MEQGSDARLPADAAERIAAQLEAEQQRQREEEQRLAQVRMTNAEEE
jgi:hypothetical protein